MRMSIICMNERRVRFEEKRVRMRDTASSIDDEVGTLQHEDKIVDLTNLSQLASWYPSQTRLPVWPFFYTVIRGGGGGERKGHVT